jgi:hypothetical protein
MNSSRIILSDWQLLTANDGIQNFLLTNNLVRTEGTQVTGDTVRNASPGTVKEYIAIWLQVLNFAILREDYQSASLLARSRAPDNPLPIRPQLLVEFINWKSLRPEDMLYVYKTSTRIQYRTSDSTWEYLHPTGDWNCNVPLYKFRSAVMYLHRLYDNLRQQYFGKCTECVIQQSNNIVPGTYRSCVNHAGRPHLRELGDPTNSTIYTDGEATVVRRLQGHIIRGAIQLLPGDVRDLRDVLVGTRVVDLQMYTMILLGIKLFLRSSELLSIRMEQFDTSLTVANSDEVRAIGIWIKGKSDKTKKALYVFKDEACPEFCPLRHLLVYLSVTGIKSGILFPFYLEGVISNTHTARQWSYDHYNSKLKYLIKNNCGTKKRINIQELRVGTHTLRKTAYLFAIWGTLKFNGHSDGSTIGNRALADIQFANILLSARHSTLAVAAGYIKDSATALAVQSKEQFNTHHAVGPWESIHLNSVPLGQSLSAYSHYYKKPLHELAQYYITKKYKLPTEGINNHISIKYILSVVLAVQPTTDIIKLLYEKLEKELNPTMCGDFRVLLDKAIRQISTEVRVQALDYSDLPEDIKCTVREHLLKRKLESGTGNGSINNKKPANGTGITTTGTETIGTGMGTTGTINNINGTSTSTGTAEEEEDTKLPPLQYYTSNATPHRRSTYTDGLDEYRKQYNVEKSVAGRILSLHSLDKYLVERYEVDGTGCKTSNLTENARVWYQKNCKKVIACIHNCYGGDVSVYSTHMETVLGNSLFQARKYCCPVCEGTANNTTL